MTSPPARVATPVLPPARPPASLAPMLGVRQDASAGAETSRGLLLTVLGEFVLPAGGNAWTQTLVSLLDLLGVREKSTRQTLARMHDRGWLHRERLGRQTRWILTDDVRRLLEPGAKRIYEFGQTARPWNGSWLVLLASVPERDRHARYHLGSRLNWAGLGTIGQGTWLSPWIEDEPNVAEVLRRLDLDATIFRAELGALGSPQALAQAAWDLPALRTNYEAFLAETDHLVRSGPTGADAAASLALLVHRWRRFPFVDPDLPAELLPSDWPGPAAARRFAEARAALTDHARRWWEASEAAFGPTATFAEATGEPRAGAVDGDVRRRVGSTTR